jgi:flagellin-like protein
MKANRKFINADERAVSAVIGVILMVAITVAIAATVYVYVSGMVGGTKKMAPTVQFTKDETTDRITVATTDSGVPWTSLSIRTDGTGVKVRINAEVTGTVGYTLTANVLAPIIEDVTGPPAVSNFLPAASPPSNIAASDFIDIEAGAAGLTTLTTFSIVHADTSSVLQTLSFTSIQAIA